MATTVPNGSRPERSLPEYPDLAQLRHQARELQRGVRSGSLAALVRVSSDRGDPDFPLHAAQLLLAREYGFPSWPRLHRQVTAIRARTWDPTEPSATESIPDRLLRLACLDYGSDSPVRIRAAAQLAAGLREPRAPAAPTQAPEPGRLGVEAAVAAVCGRPERLAEAIRADPTAASAPTGPHGWPPLFYLSYGRIETAAEDTLACARLLLAAGADPNDGRFFGGLASPFTVLTGAFGGGELDQPPHRHAIALARLLLQAGADPNDAQTLYNRQFEAEDDFLELLIAHGLGREQPGPWMRLLPDALESPTELVRGLLGWAVLHDQRDRVARLIVAGVDVTSPLSSRFASGRTPIEAALLAGHGVLADQLRSAGATEPTFGPVDAVVAAVLAGDRDQVLSLGAAALGKALRARPGLVVWAASQGGVGAVGVAVASGFGVNVLARADVFLEQPWQTALHTAVERDDPELVSSLLALGADPSIRDERFSGTPADWAVHLGRSRLLPLFTDPPAQAD